MGLWVPEGPSSRADCSPGRTLRRRIRTFFLEVVLAGAPLLHVQYPSPPQGGAETQLVVLGRFVRGVHGVGVSLSSSGSACFSPLPSAVDYASSYPSVSRIEAFVARPSGPRAFSLLVVLGLYWLSLHDVEFDR